LERILSVSQLNEYVRKSLAADPMLSGLKLRGEISNFKRHSSGHLYFSLKDEESRIACVMFRSQAMLLRVSPRDGMRVVLSGSAALYAAAGQYQFYVDSMRDDGVGKLYEKFEQLKRRLADEGLFDAGRKKPLPLLPRSVGIATSATGAVLHDIQQFSARRHPGVQLILRPTAVQGEGAAQDIARAVAELDSAVDVIIVGRGGGSLEELWAFNEEIVARAIFACETPVISAVGHETDFTIADFVADVRAATPSQAAELAVPERSGLLEQLSGMRWRLDRAAGQRVLLLSGRLEALGARLTALQPSRRIAQRQAQADALLALLTLRAQSVVDRVRFRLSGLYGRLEALSPEKAFGRGYALALGPSGKPLIDAKDAPEGSIVSLRLLRGGLVTQVLEAYDGEKNRG